MFELNIYMPKWQKDAKEFTVSVHYDEEKGSLMRVPKPILEKLGRPEEITFIIKGNTVEVKPKKE